MVIEANGERIEDLVKEGFCIVDFFSETCGPCKALAPVLARIESENPFITLVKVNTTRHPEYSQLYSINAVPTIMYYNDGELRERELGFKGAPQIKQKISDYLYE